MLHVLKSSSCKKFRKSVLQTCDKSVIQTLSEIIHNFLTNEHLKKHIKEETLKELRKYKAKLRKIYSVLVKTKCHKKRREVFVNQDGGFWAPLLTAALSALVEYGVDKFNSKNSTPENAT